MKIKSIETENFRAVETNKNEGYFEIKATSPMSKALLRLRKVKNPMLVNYSFDSLLTELANLETSTAKLADI